MAEQKDQKPAAKPKNMALILQIAFAMLNFSVMGYGGYLVYSATIGWQNPIITEETAERDLASVSEDSVSGPLIYTMDEFNVNLGGEPKRAIRLEVSLEMLGKDGFEEVMSPDSRARARDRILRLLNDNNFADLESIQGKLFLKDKIAGEINGILKRGVVKDVFFSNFLVQ